MLSAELYKVQVLKQSDGSINFGTRFNKTLEPTEAEKWQLGELCCLQFTVWFMLKHQNERNLNSLPAVHHHTPTDSLVKQLVYDETEE